MKSADLIMEAINKLTPDIKGKSFDPDWFLLRQLIEKSLTDAQTSSEAIGWEKGMREAAMLIINAIDNKKKATATSEPHH